MHEFTNEKNLIKHNSISAVLEFLKDTSKYQDKSTDFFLCKDLNWLCRDCLKLVWEVDRNRSDRLVHSLACLMALPSPSLASLCSASFSIPRSSTRLWSLARCPTGAQKRTSAPTTQTCTSTWSNTTRGEWRMQYSTSRPGVCDAEARSPLHSSFILSDLCSVSEFPFKYSPLVNNLKKLFKITQTSST